MASRNQDECDEERAIAALNRQRMIEVYAECMLTWTIVEDQLALLLDTLLHNEHGSFGSRLFFAVQTAQAREAMLKAAVTEFIRRLPHRERLAAIWFGAKKKPGLFALIETCRSHRNNLAHRTVQTAGTDVRLAGSMLWAHVDRKGIEPSRSFKQHDLERWLKEILRCSRLLSRAVADQSGS